MASNVLLNDAHDANNNWCRHAVNVLKVHFTSVSLLLRSTNRIQLSVGHTVRIANTTTSLMNYEILFFAESRKNVPKTRREKQYELFAKIPYAKPRNFVYVLAAGEIQLSGTVIRAIGVEERFSPPPPPPAPVTRQLRRGRDELQTMSRRRVYSQGVRWVRRDPKNRRSADVFPLFISTFRKRRFLFGLAGCCILQY